MNSASSSSASAAGGSASRRHRPIARRDEATPIFSLAGPVFAYLDDLHRRAAAGEALRCEGIKADAEQLFATLAATAAESEVPENTWIRARNSLIYLFDETLIRLLKWTCGEQWEENHALETDRNFAGHESRLRDLLFFQELEETLALTNTTSDTRLRQMEIDLLAVDYLVLKSGFRGQLLGDDLGYQKLIGRLEDRLKLGDGYDTEGKLTPQAYRRSVRRRTLGLTIGVSVLVALLLIALIVAGVQVRSAWTATAMLAEPPASALSTPVATLAGGEHGHAV